MWAECKVLGGDWEIRMKKADWSQTVDALNGRVAF